MILPFVYRLLNVPSLLAYVGGDPVRIFRHGKAPQGVTKPYITWFVVAGQPYDQISGAPLDDFDTVQVDCWSNDDTQVEQMATAVRDAFDAAGLSNRLASDTYEAETDTYRIGVEADFIRSR